MSPPRLSIALVLTALLLGAAPAHASSGQERAQAAGSTLLGTPAPALTLTTIDGREIDLATLYGHTAVYLKFWATWCVPCREQMPHFEHTFEQAGPDLAVIAVDAGFNDSLEDVRRYRTEHGLRMPIAIDDGRLADALNLRVTPQHVVIGRDGRIAYVGHLADERLESALVAARAAPASDSAGARAPRTPVLAELGVGANVGTASVRGEDGAALALRDPASAHATVLMFLSPWCESYLASSRPARAAACRRAREQSEALAREPGRRWIGIASGLWASAEDLAEYRAHQQVAVPLALDVDGSWFRRFGVREVPAFIVVGADGRITARIDAAGPELGRQLAKAR